MARFLVFLALALFAAAVAADSIYSDRQYEEINNRIMKCGRGLPKFGMESPADMCRTECMWAIQDGAEADTMAGTMVFCLNEYGIDDDVVQGVAQCIVKAMSKPL